MRGFCLFLALAEVLIRAQGQTYPVLVIEQQLACQILDESRILDRFTQRVDDRIEVEQRYRVTAVDGSSQAVEDQLQAERVMIAANLTLAEFELVQYRFEFLVRYAIHGDIL